MSEEVKSLIYQIKNEILKAKKDYGLEDQDNLGIKASIEVWNKLLGYIKQIRRE